MTKPKRLEPGTVLTYHKKRYQSCKSFHLYHGWGDAREREWCPCCMGDGTKVTLVEFRQDPFGDSAFDCWSAVMECGHGVAIHPGDIGPRWRF